MARTAQMHMRWAEGQRQKERKTPKKLSKTYESTVSTLVNSRTCQEVSGG